MKSKRLKAVAFIKALKHVTIGKGFHDTIMYSTKGCNDQVKLPHVPVENRFYLMMQTLWKLLEETYFSTLVKI